MPSQTSPGSRKQQTPQSTVNLVTALIVVGGLILLGFLYHRIFGAPEETLAQSATSGREPPEKYGLPAGAPPEAIAMRKQQLAAQKSAPTGR